MTCQPSLRFNLSIRAGLSETLRFCLQAVDDIDANAKATRIVTHLNVRDDAFVELTRANGITVCSADRPYRHSPLQSAAASSSPASPDDKAVN